MKKTCEDSVRNYGFYLQGILALLIKVYANEKDYASLLPVSVKLAELTPEFSQNQWQVCRVAALSGRIDLSRIYCARILERWPDDETLTKNVCIQSSL